MSYEGPCTVSHYDKRRAAIHQLLTIIRLRSNPLNIKHHHSSALFSSTQQSSFRNSASLLVTFLEVGPSLFSLPPNNTSSHSSHLLYPLRYCHAFHHIHRLVSHPLAEPSLFGADRALSMEMGQLGDEEGGFV